jgi:hypothetical protein
LGFALFDLEDEIRRHRPAAGRSRLRAVAFPEILVSTAPEDLPGLLAELRSVGQSFDEP